MLSFRYGGRQGAERTLSDQGDLVVVRTKRRGARHDVSPLSRRSRAAQAELIPLFGVASAGVGVYRAPAGRSEDIATVIDDDPEVRFAGRGLRDRSGAPVVYTENAFVKFAAGVPEAQARAAVAEAGFQIKRPVGYADNAYFLGAPEGTGRRTFERVAALLERDDVELCHPELIRELSWNRASAAQWHLQATEIDGVWVDAHADVVAAWELSQGDGITIAVIDDGVDVDHEELAGDGKVVAPQSFSPPRGDDARPTHGANHGTACAGVACAAGDHGASGVAPKARLMPIRLMSGLGSQDEADAIAWAADRGADVISCSWGPVDGTWWDPTDPTHEQVVPLPDSTRLALDYAATSGRAGRGCVIAWAAGNGNESVDNDGYASYERVIAVAACNDSNSRSAYSDYGEAIWCCFPSSNGEPSQTPGVWTTDRSGRQGYNPGDPTLGDPAGDYTNSFGGTSSACPGVAGVVALVLAVSPDLTADEIKDVLRRSCDRIAATEGEYDERGHSPRYGYGRVNAQAAVQLVLPAALSGEAPAS